MTSSDKSDEESDASFLDDNTLASKSEDTIPASKEDLQKTQLFRVHLSRYCYDRNFPELIKSAQNHVQRCLAQEALRLQAKNGL